VEVQSIINAFTSMVTSGIIHLVYSELLEGILEVGILEVDCGQNVHSQHKICTHISAILQSNNGLCFIVSSVSDILLEDNH